MRLIKLFSLLLISTSVFYIYKYTNNHTYTIMSIGDKYSLGNDNYIDYYKQDLLKTKDKVDLINYSNEYNTIQSILEKIKNTSQIKKDLREADILIINLGYNDLSYALSIEDNINVNEYTIIMNKISNNYKELIKEINKYYHNNIIIIGYPSNNTNNYYKKQGIEELNLILENESNIDFIDINKLLIPRNKYFNNSNDNIYNELAHRVIGNKITEKHLKNN